MSEFQGCNKCKNVNKRPHEEPCVNCTHCAEEHFAPMTNADRIRNMSDEELAEYLKIVQEHTIKSQQVDSIEDMLNFLQAEVKEGITNENT